MQKAPFFGISSRTRRLASCIRLRNHPQVGKPLENARTREVLSSDRVVHAFEFFHRHDLQDLYWVRTANHT